MLIGDMPLLVRQCVAEAQGFEPWEDFHPRRFSRPVHSTTLPSLRRALHTLANEHRQGAKSTKIQTKAHKLFEFPRKHCRRTFNVHETRLHFAKAGQNVTLKLGPKHRPLCLHSKSLIVLASHLGVFL